MNLLSFCAFADELLGVLPLSFFFFPLGAFSRHTSRVGKVRGLRAPPSSFVSLTVAHTDLPVLYMLCFCAGCGDRALLGSMKRGWIKLIHSIFQRFIFISSG